MLGQSPYTQTDKRSVLNRYINIANGIVLSDEIFFKKKNLLTLGKNLQVKQIQFFLD